MHSASHCCHLALRLASSTVVAIMVKQQHAQLSGLAILQSASTPEAALAWLTHYYLLLCQ
jgi:hypothetical protein